MRAIVLLADFADLVLEVEEVNDFQGRVEEEH